MVKKIFGKSYIGLILLLLYAPIMLLIIFSFTTSAHIGHWSGFSFKLYGDVFKNEEIITAFKNTIILALVSGLCATVLGTTGAIGIYFSNRRVKDSLKSISQIPILNAEIVTAIGLTVLFVAIGIKFNFVTLLIGHIIITVPFVVLSVLPRLSGMDPNMYEAALDLGAKPHKALWKVVIPEIFPGVLAGFLLAITLSLDDYIVTAFTRDNSFSTLSTYVYGVTAKKGALPASLRALTTIITVFVFVVLISINIVSKRKRVKR